MYIVEKVTLLGVPTLLRYKFEISKQKNSSKVETPKFAPYLKPPSLHCAHLQNGYVLLSKKQF